MVFQYIKKNKDMIIDIEVENLEFSVKGEYFPKTNPSIGFIDTKTQGPSIGGCPEEPEYFNIENIWWNRKNGDSIHITKLIEVLDLFDLFSTYIIKKIHDT